MHIFISYAKVDTYDLAIQLQAELRKLLDVTVWMDEILIPGESWAAQIQLEIRRCDVVVVLLSPDVNREPDGEKGHSFVINEIEYAQRRHKPIIPVMAQATDMPIQIATLQYIDFTRNETIGLKRLTQEIARRVGIAVPIRIPGPHEPTTWEQRRKFIVASSPYMPYRRPIIITGLVTFAVIILVAVILPSLNHPTMPAPTTNISLFPSDSLLPSMLASTSSLTLTNTRQPTATSLLTFTPVPLTATFTPTATYASTANPPTLTLTPQLPTVTPNMTPGFTTIIHNTDWTPIFQTFNGVEMTLVPVGCFMMGSNDADDEKPITKQCIGKPFWIDKIEVTNKQYGSEGNFKGDNHPRDSVAWLEARDFCASRDARLPTELEWEYAARGPDSLVYSWGNDFVTDDVVYRDNSDSSSAEVGSKSAGRSWVGALDMNGNLWEWVSTIYGVLNRDQSKFISTFAYPYNPGDGRENLTSDDETLTRVLRGGSWADYDTDVRSSYRDWHIPTFDLETIGFRCVRLY